MGPKPGTPDYRDANWESRFLRITALLVDIFSHTNNIFLISVSEFYLVLGMFFKFRFNISYYIFISLLLNFI